MVNTALEIARNKQLFDQCQIKPEWRARAEATSKRLCSLGFGPAPSYAEKTAIQNRIAYLYGRHVAAVSKPEADEENSRDKMAIRSAIMIAKRDKDQELLAQARERGRQIGLSPKYMADIGKTPTDVYLFSRLPDDDQKAILSQASPEERERYFRHAHQAVKREINQRQQQQLYAPAGSEL